MFGECFAIFQRLVRPKENTGAPILVRPLIGAHRLRLTRKNPLRQNLDSPLAISRRYLWEAFCLFMRERDQCIFSHRLKTRHGRISRVAHASVLDLPHLVRAFGSLDTTRHSIGPDEHSHHSNKRCCTSTAGLVAGFFMISGKPFPRHDSTNFRIVARPYPWK